MKLISTLLNVSRNVDPFKRPSLYCNKKICLQNTTSKKKSKNKMRKLIKVWKKNTLK